jgi:hypothetical protein
MRRGVRRAGARRARAPMMVALACTANETPNSRWRDRTNDILGDIIDILGNFEVTIM